MKFAHMADLHIGGWREPKISSLTVDAFKQAVDQVIEENVNFLIISGDIFNTSLPNIDHIKETTKQLRKLRNYNIPVYIVPGSHDFSPSGKTILDVLELAGLLINVVKAKKLDDDKIQLLFTEDEESGAKITGMLGKKAMLERSFYNALDKENLENEPGFKIFLFHTALDELKPDDLAEMESSPISLLPKGFDYYAGGHVHIVKKHSIDGYKNIVYPGPLFPNSFSELEKLEHGGYYLFDNNSITYKKIQLKEIHKSEIDCSNKSPEQVYNSLKDEFKYRDVKDNIVLIRLKGKLKLGRVMDINMKEIMQSLYKAGAYFVMKNTSAVSSPEFEEIKKAFDPEKIEQEIINEHLGQVKIPGIATEQEKEIISKLINTLSKEKQEGETNAVYEERISDDLKNILK